MEKRKKWRKILALILTVVMMTQNVQVFTAGTTTAELDARTGGAPAAKQTAQPSIEQIEARAGGEQYDGGTSSEEEQSLNDITDDSVSADTQTTVSKDVSAKVTQEIYQQAEGDAVRNYVQMTAKVKNNDTENSAAGVDVKVLLPQQLSYVPNGETANMSGFNNPSEAVSYGFSLDEISSDVLSAHDNCQVIMWTDQTIGAGETASYTFTALLQDGVTDVSGINSAWYVGGSACSYRWVNAEVLVPVPEETPEEIPEETPEVIPEETPEVIPEETPEVTPEETPEETPEVTPEETPEETPEVIPEETPEVTPEETPEVTPEVTPEETPEATPEIIPEVTKTPEEIAAQQKEMERLFAQRPNLQDELGSAAFSAGDENMPVALAEASKDIGAPGNKIDYTCIVNGEEYTNQVLDRDSEIKIVLNYEFSEENKPTPNDCTGYYYNIPDMEGLEIENKSLTGTIYDEANDPAGIYRIEGDKIYFDYAPEYFVTHPDEIKGTFSFKTRINKEESSNKDKITINIADKTTEILLNDTNLTGEKTYTIDEDGLLNFRIVLTAADADAQSVTVKDTLTGNLQFVEGSFVAKTESGKNVPDFEVDINGQVAKITVGTVEYNDPVIITYKVKPGTTEGGFFTGSNTASWNWGTGDGEGEGSGKHEGEAGTGNIDLDNKKLDKTSLRGEDNQLHYTIRVNQLAIDLLPNGDKITLTDILDDDVTLLYKTVQIKDAKGNDLMNKGAGFSIGSDGKTLTFVIPDNTSVVITYSVSVRGREGEVVSVKNTVELTGEIEGSSSTDDKYLIADSTATIEGKSGRIIFKKIDGYNQKELKDVKFKLYELSAENAQPSQVGGEVTSNASGNFIFENLSQDKLYYFVETEAAQGYLVKDEPWYFVLTSNKNQELIDKTKADIAKKFPNLISKINFYKDGETIARLVTNEPIPNPTSINLEAVKLVDNENASKNGEFTFTASLDEYRPLGTYTPQKAGEAEPRYEDTKSNVAEKITFNNIPLNFEGTYIFEIKENSKNDGNYNYDSSTYTITVKVGRDTSGNLEVKSKTIEKDNQIVDDIVFNNQTLTSFTLEKKVAAAALADTTFTFKVSNAGGGVKADLSNVTVSSNATVTQKEANNLTFTVNVAQGATSAPTVTVSGIPAGAKLKVEEINNPGGWTLKSAEPSGDLGNATVNLTISKDSSNGVTFTNEYGSSGDWTPKGKKTLNGRDFFKDEKFTFKLVETDASGIALADGETRTAEVSQNGDFTFDKITYKQAGTYYYQIKEVKGSTKHLTYDKTVYSVTVTVTDNGKGKLTVIEGDYVANEDTNKDKAEFTNIYEGQTSWKPEGNKTFNGDYGEDGFTFEVLENNVVKTAGTATENGKIVFGTINYTQADIGTHTYTIKESNRVRPDVTYDTKEYKVTVKVAVDEETGELTATASKYMLNGSEIDGKADFTNTYKAAGSWTPEGTKTFEGRDYKKDEKFTFSVVNEATNQKDSTGYADNTTNGEIVFGSVGYTQADINKTFNYTIQEENHGKTLNGITYSDVLYKVTVKVEKGENGTLTVTPTYTDESNKIVDKAEFTNTYTASGQWIPQGKKTLDGRNYENDEEFKFVVDEQLEGGKTHQVSTGSVTGNSDSPSTLNFDFTPITYDKEGTHSYKIYEVKGGQEESGLTYSNKVYDVQVTVTDDKNENLISTVVYTGAVENVATFTNSYKAEGHWTPKGNKTLTGREYNGTTFQYVVKDKEKGTVVSTGKNSMNGAIQFTEIDYTNTDRGKHTYEISEVNTNISGIAYDTTKWTVTVNVTDDGDGNLKVTETQYTTDGKDPEDGAYFINEYTANGEWTIEGTKTFTGRTYAENEKFQYVIKENGMEVASGASGSDGVITFDTIKYELEDVRLHKYTISEVPGDNKGITYDTTTYTVDVRVEDNGDGTITAQPVGAVPEIKFTNTYHAETEWTPEGTKDLTGRAYKDGETFHYVVMEGENQVSKGTSDSEGKITFDTIHYTQDDVGDHVYIVSEVKGKEEGLKYDESSIEITVQVADNKDGTMTVTADEQNPQIVFHNIYKANGEWTPIGTKNLRGRGYREGEVFRFVVKDEKGEIVSNGINEAKDGGNINFTPAIKYEVEDAGKTFSYTISEIAGTDVGTDYDSTVYNVEVTVTDLGNGLLETEAVYTKGVETVEYPIFDNVYGAIGHWTPEGTKNLTGRSYKPGETFYYHVKDENGKVVSTGWNNENGEIHFPRVDYEQDDAGEHTYTISEVIPDSAGTAYDRTIYTAKVTVEDAERGKLKTTVEYFNDEESVEKAEFVNNGIHFNVNKVELGSGKEIAGAELTVYGKDKDGNFTEALGSWISKEGETHDFGELLEAGEEYLLRETVAPDGYFYTSDITFSVGMDGSITTEANSTTDEDGNKVYLVEDSTSRIYVSKKAISGTDEINGAVLQILEGDTEIVRWTSETTPYYVGDKLEVGKTYTLREVSAPAGYLLAKEGIEFRVNADGTINAVKEEDTEAVKDSVVTLRDVPREVKVLKKNKEGDALEGAKLEILDKNGNIVEEAWETTSDGHIVEAELKDGEEYILRELQAPDGYMIAEDMTFTLDNEIETVEIVMEDIPTSVVISKRAFIESAGAAGAVEDKPLAGAELKIFNEKKDTVIAEWTTKADADETITGKLSVGVPYYLVEVTPPEGYAKTDDILFKLNGKSEVELLNNQGELLEKILVMRDKKTRIKVSKTDKTGEKELVGAILQIFAKDDMTNPVAEWETDGNPHYVEGLIEGKTYILHEKFAPKGYAYAADREFTVSKGSVEGNEQWFTMSDKDNVIFIIKRDITTKKELPGAKLEIHDLEGNVLEAWESTIEAHEVDYKLEAGKEYILHEVSAPDGYALAEDVKFTVNRDGKQTYVYMDDTPTKAQILKVDENGEGLSGAVLQILDAKGKEIDRWTTDGKPHEIETKLIAGVVYTLCELSAPAGYRMAADIEFTVDEDGKPTTVTMKDTPTKVTISKREITGKESLGGAELRVIEEESGKVVIEKWTTEAGKDTVVEGKLNVGVKYLLQEVTPPAGYATAKDIPFMLNSKGEVVVDEETKELLMMLDEETRIKVIKTDKTGENELVGAILQIFAKDDMTNPVAEWETDGKPHYVEGLIVGKTYILHEKFAPEGYAYAADVEFKVEEDSVEGNEQKVTMWDAKNVVVVTKTDLTGTKELPGAELEIRDLNGKVLEAWTSTTEEHKVTYKLEAGKEYILHEVSAPDGYAIAEDIKFTVNLDGSPTQVVMKDAPTNVTINKTDLTGEKQISGAVLQILDAKGKEIDKWTTDGKPHAIETKMIAGAVYTLRELSAPAGYRMAADIEFTVDEDGKATTVTMKDAPTKVQILKVDENGKALSGATLAVKDSSGAELDKWVSDGSAHVIEGKLTVGETYILSELSAPNGYTVAEDMKFTVTDDKDVIEVTMKNYPAKGKGKITVTKKVSLMQDLELKDLMVKDDTFYVNLFTDKEGSYPYKGAAPQALHLVNASTATVTFDNLAAGTYYVYETDANGNAMRLNEILQHNGEDFQCIVDDGGSNEVALDFKAGVKEGYVNLNNVFYDLPDGYAYMAWIDISKQVLKGTSETTVDDTFYAGVFTRDEDGVYNLYTVVELVQNDTVRVEVPLGGETGDQPVKYYILETDAEGNIVDLDTFEYEVSGEGTVALSQDNMEGEITIVNKVPEDKEGKLMFQKVDGGGVGLAGAQFRLLDEDGETVEEWVSEASAKEFVLEPGEYTLKELGAPSGYTGGGELAITVDEDYNISVSGSMEYSFANNLLKVVNRAKKTTTTITTEGTAPGARTLGSINKIGVKTGDDTPIALYVLLLAVAALAVGGGVYFKKKKRTK